jgi:hypothetical protein
MDTQVYALAVTCAERCDESHLSQLVPGLDCGEMRKAMRRMLTCAYCKRLPRYKAGYVYLCAYHAKYKRPYGLLPQRIS